MKYPRVGEIQRLIDRGLVRRQKHPNYAISIYNYTHAAGRLAPEEWSDTLSDCRGLVLHDRDYEIVARGFRKFWNKEQVTDFDPHDIAHIEEKMDGSLLIVFNYDGKRVVATRGSFTSEQAWEAEQWFQKNESLPWRWKPREGESWLFEWISPNNRIVVDYGDRKEAVLLAILDTEGRDIPRPSWARTVFSYPAEYTLLEFAELMEADVSGKDMEGFVIRLVDGRRAKAKKEDYVRLHRLITTLSNVSIWELLKDGRMEELRKIRESLPLEVLQAMDAEVIRLLTERYRAEAVVRAVDTYATRYLGLTYPSRDLAVVIQGALEGGKMQSAAFSVAAGRSNDASLWRAVRPRWKSLLHKESGEDG